MRDQQTLDPIATFSLVARDQETGDLGVVVASKFLAVGAYVPTAVAGVGAVASQSYVNLTYGPHALEMLRRGASPADCVAEFRATDPQVETRQLGIVAADGRSVTFTGADCHAWAGGVLARASPRRATSSRDRTSSTLWWRVSAAPTCRSPSGWWPPSWRPTPPAATAGGASRRPSSSSARPRGTPA